MELGKFIVFEGIDGSGTSTQAELLAKWIRSQGLKVLLTNEPSSGQIGQLIRKLLANQSSEVENDLLDYSLALLFAADRLDHIYREILPKLRKGYIIISDRYSLSSLAYQTLKCEWKWVEKINKEAIPADLIILLDLDAEKAIARIIKRNNKIELFMKEQEIYEKIEIQKKVRQLYLEAVKKLSEKNEIIVLDGSKNINQIHKEVIQIVKPYIPAQRYLNFEEND